MTLTSPQHCSKNYLSTYMHTFGSICMSFFVCIHIYVYVCIHIHTYIYRSGISDDFDITPTLFDKQLVTYTHFSMYAYLFICIHTHLCLYIHIRTYVDLGVLDHFDIARLYMHTYIHMWMSIYTYVYIHMWTWEF